MSNGQLGGDETELHCIALHWIVLCLFSLTSVIKALDRITCILCKVAKTLKLTILQRPQGK